MWTIEPKKKIVDLVKIVDDAVLVEDDDGETVKKMIEELSEEEKTQAIKDGYVCGSWLNDSIYKVITN